VSVLNDLTIFTVSNIFSKIVIVAGFIWRGRGQWNQYVLPTVI